MGNTEGRSSRAHTSPGGPEILLDGLGTGSVRGQLDLRERGPIGPPRLPFRQIDWAPVDDPGGDRVNLVGHWGGRGRSHPDAGGVHPGLHVAVNPLLGAQDFVILDPASVGASGFFLTELVIEQIGVTGLTTAPTISLGTNGPGYDNVIPVTLMSMATGGGKLAHVFRPHDWSTGAGPTSAFVPSGTDLVFRVHPGAAATTLTIRPYVVGLIVR